MSANNVLESTAASILQRAVQLDKNGRLTEALVCYQEGLQILLDCLKGVSDAQMKETLKKKIDAYFERAEQIKKTVKEKKVAGTFYEQICITSGSKGYSYEALMGRFLDNEVISLRVEDPYIRNVYQCRNYLRFCELAVKKCKNLKKIVLKTSSDPQTVNEQESHLKNIQRSLKCSYDISMEIEQSSTIHDRQILLNNGWIIKIGRGLNYFQPSEGKFSIGEYDLDLRTCLETNVDIYYSKDMTQNV